MILSLSTLLAALVALSPWTANAHCSLDLLQATTTSYIAAQTAGRASSLNISSTALYTENFQAADLHSGILSQPLKIDSAFSIHDTSACAAFVKLIITDPAHPYGIGSQIRLNDHGENPTIEKLETIVTDDGDWLFNATNALYWTNRESWDVIPRSKRDTRATLLAAANAYLDKFTDNTIKVPFNTPCARLEGGVYTGTGEETDSCDVGFPTGIPMLNRRFVVDPSYGTVNVFFNFGGPTHSPDSHLFRLLDGKIRYVHTLTVTKCPLPNLPEDACNAW